MAATVAGCAVPEGRSHVVHVHQPSDGFRGERQRLAGGVAHLLPRSDGVPGQRPDEEGESQAPAMSGSRSFDPARSAPRRRAAAASAAAMTAVVTGRISTWAPRGRSSQYGSAGRSRVSTEKLVFRGRRPNWGGLDQVSWLGQAEGSGAGLGAQPGSAGDRGEPAGRRRPGRRRPRDAVTGLPRKPVYARAPDLRVGKA